MATLWNRILRKNPHGDTTRSGMVRLTGSVVVGSTGAVSSSDTPGFTVTRTTSKPGRYRIQLVDKDGSTAANPCQPVNSSAAAIAPWGIQDIHVAVVSANADAALTTDSPVGWAIRNFTPLSGYFDIQFATTLTSTGTATFVDKDIESGGQFLIGFSIKLSSVTP